MAPMVLPVLPPEAAFPALPPEICVAETALRDVAVPTFLQ